MIHAIMQTLALTFVAFLLVACVRGWIRLIRRYRLGQPLLEWEPRAIVPWTVWEVVAAIAVFLFAQLLAATAIQYWVGREPEFLFAEMTGDQWVGVFLVDSLAKLSAAGLWLLLIRRAVRATWEDIGIQRGRILEDFWLGGAVFVILGPPVYALQALLAYWMPYEHPLIEMLQARWDPLFLLVSGLAALIVAPVVEEFFFRTLLQGWFERLHTRGLSFLSASPPPAFQVGDPPSADLPEPAEPAESAAEPVDQEGPASASEAAAKGTWPILVTALLFALMHFPHGIPALVTLTIYAVGIGYVYRQTHRLVPCIVAHLALNAVSLLALALAILES